MTFPPPYQPLPDGIRVKYKDSGKPLELNAELEEYATWWAEAEIQEFGTKQKVIDNFWKEFKARLDPVSTFLSSNFTLFVEKRVDH